MVDFAVDVSKLAGFKLDLQDLGATFSSNANRLLPMVALPTGTTGQLATLTPSVQRLQSALSSAHQSDLRALGALGANLGTAENRFQNSDEQRAAAISQAAATAFGGRDVPATSSAQGVSRFRGLQLPILQDVQEAQYTVRQVVTASIEILTPYDEPLSQAIGIKPVGDYLSPLVADWEALQSVGKRIGQLGINDYVTSENLSNGASWLQNSWSGEASTAFGTAATALGGSIAGRSRDLDAVAKIVENGGPLLERLVYNQAMDLADTITKSMSFLDFTLPLGVWAQLLNSPMQDSMKSQVSSAVDALKKSAATRRDTISNTIERISGALNYEPGRTAPSYNPSEFELPDKVTVDLGASRYGYGDNVWWEHAIGSAG
ncbi:hypothetical protein [Nocardia gipuzkoensis]|uniref:hypothetical protein n=1 Tax=Nocardia gipuzkoensis TaxID=2749991 RepID=UPI00237DF106|nr:hypothetical protein [Nocardia gipuzkoensis]MDE1671257.1 hypothetical protein [Nocardia gipuzkoensis]